MGDIKKIPLCELLKDSLLYVRENKLNMFYFSLVHIFLLVLGFEAIDGWHDVFFLPWLLVYYLFWCFFFRFYFGRRPYLLTPKLVDTLVPSTKMLTITFVVITFLLALPLIPPFLGIGSQWAIEYSYYLQKYMEDSKVVDTVTVCVFLLVSPFVFFRPMMAWISSLLGRSGSFKTAFAKTKGNYWQMMKLLLIFEAILVAFEQADSFLQTHDYFTIVLGTPVIILLNVVLAKTYDYFFREIEG